MISIYKIYHEMKHKISAHVNSFTSYLIFLPYSMCSCLRLQIILGIPVRVKNDNGICSCEVDSKTSGTCGQEETEILKYEEKKFKLY